MQTFRAAADLSEGHPQLPRVTAAAWVSPTVATARPCSTPRDGPSNREGFRAANEMGRGCPCLPPDPRLGYQGCSLGLKGRARRGSLTAWREGAQVLGCSLLVWAVAEWHVPAFSVPSRSSSASSGHALELLSRSLVREN